MRYGVNYRGSKNFIAKDIVNAIAKNTGISKSESATFYDLFGGGFAMSHYVLENTNWNVVYNEPYNFIADFIKEFVINKRPVPFDFITRREFERATKLSEPTKSMPPWKIGFIKSTFSFSGNLLDYLYGKNNETEKQTLHEGILKETDYLQSKCKPKVRINYLKEKRYYKKNKKSHGALESLERLQSLESLESLERLGTLRTLRTLRSEKKRFYRSCYKFY